MRSNFQEFRISYSGEEKKHLIDSDEFDGTKWSTTKNIKMEFQRWEKGFVS
jgi:hypothetical protein